MSYSIGEQMMNVAPLTFSRITLRRNKADAVKRFHPWIFSGAIQAIAPQGKAAVEDGDWVEVYSHSGEFLAAGLYSPGSIAVKLLAFEPIADLDRLFVDKLQQAYALRQAIGLASSTVTTCYRLVNAEGDGLPGLIIDWYNGTAVLQAYSQGMYAQRDRIVRGLQQVYGKQLQAVYDKSASVLPGVTEQQYLLSDSADAPQPEADVLENGYQFRVNWQEGQKTGFFLDQRRNRSLLGEYAPGRTVLNTFCYSGGFSVYAIGAGAALVHSVDSSAKAIDWASQNVARNNPHAIPHDVFTADVFTFLKNCPTDFYDAIVLDPPAFAKNLSARHQAVMAYKRLNQQAFSKIRSGGLVFTFSCSQVVTVDRFQGAVMAGAIEAGRQIQILAHLSQPADHPTSVFHPEGIYLKGLVLRVQ